MKKFEIPTPFYVIKMESHNEIKDEVLRLIQEQSEITPSDGYSRTDEIIEQTELFVNADGEYEKLHNEMQKRPYLQVVMPHLQKSLIDMAKYLKSDLAMVGIPWFSQYTKDQFVNWHYHEWCHWVFVYYIEFPEGSPFTRFRTVDTNQVFEIPVEEGDIAIFPAMYKHCTRKNETNSRKTVITFNASHMSTALNYDKRIYDKDINEEV